MDNIERMIKSHEGLLKLFDDSIQQYRLFIEKLIKEIQEDVKNHSVQSDQVNLAIECRRMFYERKQGARTFNVDADSRDGSACYGNLPPQDIEGEDVYHELVGLIG
uniref:Uncharacterized protein n=1 Tax=Schistosoma haematobium TaxID=6185 RepID=A0A095A2E7_SCHHA